LKKSKKVIATGKVYRANWYGLLLVMGECQWRVIAVEPSEVLKDIFLEAPGKNTPASLHNRCGLGVRPTGRT
jgi:hypothetical protein